MTITSTSPAEPAGAAAPIHSVSRPAKAWLFIVGGLGVVFLLGVRAAWFFTIDDAYITFRYSLNMADGDGPVWNVGEDPVEGFTNFLWMVWHTPFVWLGIALPTVAKLTSLVAGALALLMLVRYSWQRFGTVAALVAGGTFVVFLPTYFHLTGGLETVAFAALVLRIVIVALGALDGRDTRSWELPLMVVLAGMLRPEGVLAAAPAFLIWLWPRRTDRRVWFWSAGAVLAGSGYFLWRFLYYGHLFPNTFYVKFGNIDAGAAWLKTTAPVLGPLLALTLFLVVRGQTRPAGALLTTTVATTYLTYVVSGPTMDYVHRFAFHAFPLLCLGAGLAVGLLRPRPLAAAVGALAVGWIAYSGTQPADLATVANYGPDLQRAHVAIGQGLAKADIPAEHRTVALHDAGATPYYSGWNTIDYIGLNDEPIAHGADPTARVTEARPTVFIVRGLSPAVPAWAYSLNVTRTTEGYERIATIPMRANYYLHVFALPEWANDLREPLLAETDRAQRTYDPGRLELTLDRWLDRLRTELPW